MAFAELLRRPRARSTAGRAPNEVRARAVAAAHGAVIALSPAFPGARVLLLGPDAECGAATAAFFGAETACYKHPEAARSSPLSLPYTDASFDAIVLSEGLEDDSRPEVRTEQHHTARSELLSECARVLRPGGTLLLLTRTPETFPLARCAEQIQRAGFDVSGSWSLHPATRAWKQMIPLALPIGTGEREQGRSFAVRARGVAARFSATQPTRACLIRAVRGDAAGATSVIDEMLAPRGGTSSGTTLFCRGYSGSITCEHGSSFIKLPLNPVVQSQSRAVRELFEQLDGQPIAEHLPLPHHQGSANGIEYFIASRIEHRGGRRMPSESALATILGQLSTGAEAIRIDRSDFWARVFSPQISRPLEELGAGAALEYLTSLADRIVPCGLVHGDLHLFNVLDRRGELFLIDWDQFERRSPRFLDVVDLSAALVNRDPLSRVRHPLLNPLRLIATGSKGIPFARLLDSESASLLPGERVLLYLLHRASWRCTNNPRLIPRDQEYFRRSLRRCLHSLSVVP